MEARMDLVRRIVIFAALLLIIGWCVQGVGLNLKSFADIGKTIELLKRFFPPDEAVFGQAVKQTVITLQIAITATFFALVLAFPLSFAAARNTGTRGIADAIRAVLSFIRSVPEIVWGLLFVPALGLGPVPGVMAIFLHNIGVFGKLISELVEASEKDPQLAMLAVGSNRAQIIRYAIIPEILPNVLSQYFYRLEVGVRTSLILGFIGAGGIGNMLFIDFKVFDYQAVMTEILVIMVLVWLIDSIGGWVRKRVI